LAAVVGSVRITGEGPRPAQLVAGLGDATPAERPGTSAEPPGDRPPLEPWSDVGRVTIEFPTRSRRVRRGEKPQLSVHGLILPKWYDK
jgi:hypothetical protein